MLLLNVAVLPWWFVTAGLSVMAFDAGFAWRTLLFLQPLWLYPVWIVLFSILALRAQRRRWNVRAVVYSLLPLAILLGWFAVLHALHRLT